MLFTIHNPWSEARVLPGHLSDWNRGRLQGCPSGCSTSRRPIRYPRNSRSPQADRRTNPCQQSQDPGLLQATFDNGQTFAGGEPFRIERAAKGLRNTPSPHHRRSSYHCSRPPYRHPAVRPF